MQRSKITSEVDGAAYPARVEALLAQYSALPPGSPVRLAKRTSNLFRTRTATGAPGLDVSAFTGVLAVDTEARTADVLGMTTYEDLVAATLPHGLIPLVVPQLRTITIGGAVSGLGIESSSFRNGLPHESVLEMDVLTGDGRVVTARPEGEHAGLFFGMPNSYGTLGYALRLRIELEPAAPYVRLRHVRFSALDELFGAMGTACAEGEWAGLRADFVDAMVVSPVESYLVVGTFEQSAPYTSDYTGQQIFYRSIQQRSTDFLTTHDYIWRWDTDWFWCSQAFGAQHPLGRRLWPKAKLRSDVYARLVRLEDRFRVAARLDQLRGRPRREKLIQDVEVPIGRAAEFARWFDREIGMTPIWACPLRQRDPSRTWDLYAFDPYETYVNFGFWGTVPLPAGEAPGYHDPPIERMVDDLGGRKSLYSTATYSEEEFWALYGGAAYQVLKKDYDGGGRLLDLYAKCVGRR